MYTIHTDPLHRIAYATDASAYREVPQGVAFPENEQDIVYLIETARERKTHLIPRAGGTSIAGQVVGSGIVVDISKHFKKILEINSEERWARVQPGVVLDELNLALEPYGAIIGMEGAGPANGTCRPVNLLMASDNCFAMDVAQATIMDYRINDIFILNEARLRHLIPKDIVYPVLNATNLVIKDYDRVPIRRKTRFIRSLVIPFVGTPLQRMKQRREPAPQFMDEKCIRCLRCANICPAKALTLKEEADGTKHIVCDYSRCIRCYCCHEMCPVDAITVHNKEKKAE